MAPQDRHRIYDFGVYYPMPGMASVLCAAILIACIKAHNLLCPCGHPSLYEKRCFVGKTMPGVISTVV